MRIRSLFLTMEVCLMRFAVPTAKLKRLSGCSECLCPLCHAMMVQWETSKHVFVLICSCFCRRAFYRPTNFICAMCNTSCMFGYSVDSGVVGCGGG